MNQQTRGNSVQTPQAVISLPAAGSVGGAVPLQVNAWSLNRQWAQHILAAMAAALQGVISLAAAPPFWG
jgi:hypothetical protein